MVSLGTGAINVQPGLIDNPPLLTPPIASATAPVYPKQEEEREREAHPHIPRAPAGGERRFRGRGVSWAEYLCRGWWSDLRKWRVQCDIKRWPGNEVARWGSWSFTSVATEGVGTGLAREVRAWQNRLEEGVSGARRSRFLCTLMRSPIVVSQGKLGLSNPCQLSDDTLGMSRKHALRSLGEVGNNEVGRDASASEFIWLF